MLDFCGEINQGNSIVDNTIAEPNIPISANCWFLFFIYIKKRLDNINIDPPIWVITIQLLSQPSRFPEEAITKGAKVITVREIKARRIFLRKMQLRKKIMLTNDKIKAIDFKVVVS